MTDGDPDVTRLLRDLTRELQRLQRELEPETRRGLPSPAALSRFTSEVTIPAIILVLETNIRTLQLLRRTIRLADGRELRDSGEQSTVRRQVESVGQATLTRLDSALADVQESLDDQSNGEPAELLDDARSLQRQIRTQLSDADTDEETAAVDIDETDSDPVDIDVDAELRTLKDNLEDDETGGDDKQTPDGDGNDHGGSPDGDDTDDNSTGGAS